MFCPEKAVKVSIGLARGTALLVGALSVVCSAGAAGSAAYRGTLVITKTAEGRVSFGVTDLDKGRCPARFILKPGSASLYDPSPDGKFIATLFYPDPNLPSGPATLAILDVRAGTVHRIAAGVTDVGGWIGRRLLYWRGHSAKTGRLASMNEQGHVVVVSVWPTRVLHSLSPSPDGRFLSYVVQSGDGRAGTLRFTVQTRRLGGGAVRRVYQGPTGFGGSDPSVSWSPDSRLLLISDISLLFRVRPDGGGLRQLDHPRPYVTDDEANWSPNGHSILFTRRFQSQDGTDQGADLYLMRADGTHLHRLTQTPRIPSPSYADGSRSGIWSPDGRAIAFVRNNALVVMRPDGTGRRIICGANAKGPVIYGPLIWRR
jgi:hypothetical protein